VPQADGYGCVWPEHPEQDAGAADEQADGADDAPGRVAIRAALQALDAQAEAIAITGQLFGFDLPVRPAPGPGGR
jgi:hypothetical protein